MKRLAVLLAVIVFADCTDLPTRTVEIQSPLLGILDGAHGGDPHFFFLLPLVPDPGPTGVFDPRFLPYVQVEICAWVDTECGAPIAHFTSEGEGSERIRIGDEEEDGDNDQGGDDNDAEDADGDDEDEQHYIVNWNTADYSLNPNTTYRIRVLVREVEFRHEVEFGHIDVDVVETGKELKGIDEDAFVGIVNGRTLPIKFRIEEGVRGAAVISVGGGEIVSQNDRVALVIPEGAVGQEVLFIIHEAVSIPSHTGLVGPAYELGPTGINFTEPVRLTIDYAGLALPAGVTKSDLTIIRAFDTGWEAASPFPHNGVNDLALEQLTVPVLHLSRHAVAGPPQGFVEVEPPWNWRSEFWVPTSYREHWNDCCWEPAVDFYIAQDQVPGAFTFEPQRASVGRPVLAAHNGQVEIVEDEVDCGGVGWVRERTAAGDLTEDRLPYRFVRLWDVGTRHPGSRFRTLYFHMVIDGELDGQFLNAGDRLGVVANPEDPDQQLGPDGVSAVGCARTAHLMFVVSIDGVVLDLTDPNRVSMGGETVFAGPQDPDPASTDFVFGAMPRAAAGGTFVDKDLGIIGTAAVFDPIAFGGAVEISGPPIWNADNPVVAGVFQPSATAPNRSMWWDLITPASGSYSASALSTEGIQQALFSIDAANTLNTPSITSVTLPAAGQIQITWVPDPDNKSCLLRVNDVPWPGFSLADHVVSCAQQVFLFTSLPLIAGRTYQAVVFGLSSDVQTPESIVAPFNVAADDIVFVASGLSALASDAVAPVPSAAISTPLMLPPSPPVQ